MHAPTCIVGDPIATCPLQFGNMFRVRGAHLCLLLLRSGCRHTPWTLRPLTVQSLCRQRCYSWTCLQAQLLRYLCLHRYSRHRCGRVRACWAQSSNQCFYCGLSLCLACAVMQHHALQFRHLTESCLHDDCYVPHLLQHRHAIGHASRWRCCCDLLPFARARS